MSMPGGPMMVLPNVFPLAPDGSWLFPILPGLTLEYTQRPTFDNIVQPGADRSVTVVSLDPYPLWEYDLAFGYISDDPSYNVPDPKSNPSNMTQLDQIAGLFLACGGRRDPFLMDLAQITKKRWDSTVEGAPIGIGDGTNTAFQLVRPVYGFLDFIDNPIVGTVQIMITPSAGAASVAPYASIVNGLVTLFDPPPAGAVVTASFSWLHRMRFTSDAEGFDGMVYRLHTRGSLKLAQDRSPQP